MGPALQGAVVIRGGQSRPPLRGDGFPRQRHGHWLGMTALQRPLDKPAGMGIIINTRGRCIRRSVPVSLKLYLDLNDPQKPSPCPVAVFAFQSLDSSRDRMTQNMNRKHEKHTVPPPFEEVTNRLTMYAASLGRVYTAGGFLSNIGGTHVSRREVRIAPGGARGPRPTGCGGRMGRTGSFAPTRFVRDVGDAAPYEVARSAPNGTSGTPSPTKSQRGRCKKGGQVSALYIPYYI